LELKRVEEIEALSISQSTSQASYLQAMSESKSKYESELKETITNYRKQIEDLQTERKRALETAEETAELRRKEILLEAQNQLKSEITVALQTQRKKMTEKHKSEMDALRLELSSSSESILREKLEQAQRQASFQIESAVSVERKQVVADYEQRLKSLENSLTRDAAEELRNERGRFESELEAVKLQGQKNCAYLQTEMEQLRLSHSHELQVLLRQREEDEKMRRDRYMLEQKQQLGIQHENAIRQLSLLYEGKQRESEESHHAELVHKLEVCMLENQDRMRGREEELRTDYEGRMQEAVDLAVMTKKCCIVVRWRN